MTVYVDAPLWKLGRMKMCHMIADTATELHRMADLIGVDRRHYQNKPGQFPHYDVCKSLRAIAVGAGAKECNRREFVAAMRRIRASAAAVPSCA